MACCGNIFLLAWVTIQVKCSPASQSLDETTENPCASKPNGWQLLFWPDDGQCYRIFQKGYPCPETMELTPGKNGIAECKCPPGTALNSRDAVCYKLYQKGPCGEDEYFGPVTKQSKSSQGHRWGACFQIEDCEENKVFWAKDGKCYDTLTKGPCPEGLLVRNDGRVAECACSNDTMPDHFWEPGLSCHQHHTRGPCDPGLIFLPNGTCGCTSSMKEYYPKDHKCYPLGSRGPCKEGHVFRAEEVKNGDTSIIQGSCSCQDGFVLWPEDGKCYYPFTKGPCKQGDMIEVSYTQNNTNISCVPVPCPVGKLYFPGGKGCHKVGTQGPCPDEQIVFFQAIDGAKPEDFSYLGVCGCVNSQSDHSSFFPLLKSDTSSCHQQRYLSDSSPLTSPNALNVDSLCGSVHGFVLWKDDSCWRLYSQGPCKDGEWLVPDRSKGHREGRGWRMGKCECRPGYTTTPTGNSTICTLNRDFFSKFLRNLS